MPPIVRNCNLWRTKNITHRHTDTHTHTLTSSLCILRRFNTKIDILGAEVLEDEDFGGHKPYFVSSLFPLGRGLSLYFII